MKLPRRLAIVCASVLAFAGAPHLAAPDEPVAAGSEGVPVPKKTKHVQPVYPQEALAQGVRGIVILDLVLDARGKVEATSVIRSVPGLDEAAIAAARQWEYEPTKADGKPVRVRLTVPITFALALPKLERQAGVPDLRQGANPTWPSGATGGGLVTAEVTLEPDGRVGVARVLEGGAPWAASLLAALRTWRFSPRRRTRCSRSGWRPSSSNRAARSRHGSVSRRPGCSARGFYRSSRSRRPHRRPPRRHRPSRPFPPQPRRPRPRPPPPAHPRLLPRSRPMRRPLLRQQRRPASPCLLPCPCPFRTPASRSLHLRRPRRRQLPRSRPGRVLSFRPPRRR